MANRHIHQLVTRRVRTTSVTMLTALALAVSVFALAPVQAATVVDSTPSNPQGWANANVLSGGTVSRVYTDDAPYGFAALRLTTNNTTASKAQYRIAQPNANLSTLGDLSYWSKALSGPALASATLQVEVRLTGGSFGTVSNLVFEPYWQNGTGDPAPVVPNVWQNWTNMETTGRFWSSRTLNVGTCSLVNGAGGPPLYTIPEVIAMCPDATVVGIALNVGTFNVNYDVLADGVSFNGTTYNFELNPVFQPTGEIRNPARRGQKVFTDGSALLSAIYDNGSDDVADLSWSVVAGDCDTGTPVAGNIGGFTDAYQWDGERFRATLDTTGWANGAYCFVFDPLEGLGQNDVRLTETFTVAT